MFDQVPRRLVLLLPLMGLVYCPIAYAQTGKATAAHIESGEPALASTGTPESQWELVHEVDILLPQAKKVFGRVEVMLDRNSIDVRGHEVYYRARVYRASQTSEAETMEQRVSDCRKGLYKLEKVTNLRTGKDIEVAKDKWRKPRQPHVVKLEHYVCEKVCGIGYPDQKKSRGASCLAR